MTSSVLQEHFFSPRNVGELGENSYRGSAGSTSCGAAIRIAIDVDSSQTVTAIKFKAAGCNVLVATASVLTESAINKTTAEAAELALNVDQIAESLSDGHREKRTCGRLAGEALLTAITAYSDTIREEWNGDESLICTCFCVSERTIESEIQKGHLSTVLDVTRACSAGGGCRSCWPLIEDMLAVERAAR
jgi:NifU-like protein